MTLQREFFLRRIRTIITGEVTNSSSCELQPIFHLFFFPFIIFPTMASSANLAAVLHATNDLRIEPVSSPIKTTSPPPDMVLLEMRSVGICGSDVHYWTHGRIGDFVLNSPMILGHESSGVVVAVGEGVTHLHPGDRVAIEPGVPCMKCEDCKTGRYNLCQDVKFCATPPYDGSLANYYIHHASFCYKLPDHVSFEEAALLEPLSVGIHAVRRAGVQVGDVVLICGAGPIGLVNIMVAKAAGAAKVVVADLSPSRLQLAKTLGADQVVQVTDEIRNDPTAISHALLNVLGVHPKIVIECTGAVTSVHAAILTARQGGVCVFVGMGPDLVLPFPLLHALCKEIDIKGIFRYCNSYPTALAMVANGVVNVKPLVTHRFTLENALQAFETAKDAKSGAIKVVIDCTPNVS